MKRLSPRAWLLLMVALGLVVSISAASIVLSLKPGSSAQPTAGSAAAAPSGPPPGSAQARADLSQMQTLLNSGSVSAQSALLAPPLKFAPGSGPIVSAGKTVTIRPGTLRSDGQFGLVEASVSNGTTDTLGLSAVQGHWRLYAVKAGSVQTKAKISAAPGGPVRAQLLSATSYACPDLSMIGKRTPVVFIHGYTGKPSDWGSDYDPASMFFKIDMMHGTYVLAFDYSKASTSWVTNQAIGPDFASYIDCVAQASKTAHGPGKVIVVAHSMGGLATRYAATKGVNASTVAGDIAMVITWVSPRSVDTSP